ncbi:DUF1207 domain-containing protein [Kolteria novifilia]
MALTFLPSVAPAQQSLPPSILPLDAAEAETLPRTPPRFPSYRTLPSVEVFEEQRDPDGPAFSDMETVEQLSKEPSEAPAPFPVISQVEEPEAMRAMEPMTAEPPMLASDGAVLEYRPIASYAAENVINRPLTENTWVLEPVHFEDYPRTIPTPEMGQDVGPPLCETYSDADACSLLWSRPLRCDFLPTGLLWQPPMANQRAPRMYGKFNNANDENTIDTAIGGEFGLIRFAPEGTVFEGIQLDGFAAVFTRFNEQRLLKTSDFRAGIPLTYAKGNWQAKISYEHTSTHMGDEYYEKTGRLQVPHVRDEIVFGLSYRFWNQLRLYGQAGFSFITSDEIEGKIDRYDWGLEWAKQRSTGLKGQPFAAFDMDVRSDQEYTANLTFQIGWMWMKMRNRHAARIALEVYSGKSPYGQFYQDNDDYIGAAFMYDW